MGLWHDNQLYRFATYTGAKIELLEIKEEHVRWILRDREHTLELVARRGQGGLILGPTRIDMGKRVNEILQATVDVRLETHQGVEVFSGRGLHAGLEVQGELERLQLA